MNIVELENISLNIHKLLGRNFPKEVYINALRNEFNDLYSFECNKNVSIRYKNQKIYDYIIDFIIQRNLIQIIIIDSISDIIYNTELYKNILKHSIYKCMYLIFYYSSRIEENDNTVKVVKINNTFS
jgi:hypothetical protein